MKIEIIGCVILSLVNFLGMERLPKPAFNSENRITVLYEEDIKWVNPQVFGTNVIVSLPEAPENKSCFYDYGGGFWDPDLKIVPPGIKKIFEDAKFSVIRFQTDTRDYVWENTVGPGRTQWRYGIDEYLDSAESAGAETSLIIDWWKCSPESAAALVARCAGRVKYFEIGNEIYNSAFGIPAAEYVAKYLDYYAAMKAVDTDIKLGVPFLYHKWPYHNALLAIKDKIDFLIIHNYPAPWIHPTAPEHVIPPNYYLLELSRTLILDAQYKSMVADFGKPIAVTEYNGGFQYWEQREYRWNLSQALIIADMIKLIVENDVLYATQFDFLTYGFGMVSSDFTHGKSFGLPAHLNDPYYLRPIYYVYKLYADHFKAILVNTEVISEMVNKNLEYLSVTASKAYGDSSICVMAINRKDQPMNVDIYIPGFTASSTVMTYSLEGKPGTTLESHNENGELVGIVTSSAHFENEVCNVTLSKYSMTAIVINKK
jgi:hypothetical protein